MGKIVSSLIMLLWFLSHHIQAQQWPKLTVVTEHWPPFNYINEQGMPDGIATRKLRHVLTKAGFDYHIELQSWSRAYQQARDNPNVLIYTIFRSEERLDDFQWICPLIQTGGSEVYSLAYRIDIQVASTEDLKSWITGVYASGWSHDYLTGSGLRQGEHLDVVSDEMANVRKLFANRVDLIVQEPDLIEGRLKQLGKTIDDIRPVFVLGDKESKTGCMAMSTDTSESIVTILRETLNSIKE